MTQVEKWVDEPVWAVRWGEIGSAPQFTKFTDEASARSFHRFLLEAYERRGRKVVPQLLSSKIEWEVTK